VKYIVNSRGAQAFEVGGACSLLAPALENVISSFSSV